MKSAILVSIFLFASASFADCVNLSHKFKLAETDVDFKQVSCGQIDRQMYFQGQPVGDVDHQIIDGQWKADSVDDQYETFTRQIRWTWNSQGTVLIYEYFIDTVNKESGDQVVQSGTQLFSKVDDGVEFREFTQLRIAKPNGDVTVTQDQNHEVRSAIP